MKRSKQVYYDKYFETKWNNIKNTWKGIKSLISLKSIASNVPTVLSLDNSDTITNPYDIANTFNNYFASIAENTTKKHKIIFTYINIFQTVLQMKLVTQYSCNLMIKKKYLTSYLLSTLIRLLVVIVYLTEYYILKNEISKHLTDLFNLSFMTGVFPSVLKAAKVVPIFKKYSKLDYIDYCPISLLSNVEKNT